MRRAVFALLAFAGPFSVSAGNPMRICEEAPEFATLFPNYQSLPTAPRKHLSGTPISIRSQKPGTTACVALAVDETGVPQDAMVFLPPALSLSKRERKTILGHRFSPAFADGKAVRSIELIRVDKSRGYAR